MIKLVTHRGRWSISQRRARLIQSGDCIQGSLATQRLVAKAAANDRSFELDAIRSCKQKISQRNCHRQNLIASPMVHSRQTLVVNRALCWVAHLSIGNGNTWALEGRLVCRANPVAMELFPRVQAEKLEHLYIYILESPIYIFLRPRKERTCSCLLEIPCY